MVFTSDLRVGVVTYHVITFFPVQMKMVKDGCLFLLTEHDNSNLVYTNVRLALERSLSCLEVNFSALDVPLGCSL